MILPLISHSLPILASSPSSHPPPPLHENESCMGLMEPPHAKVFTLLQATSISWSEKCTSKSPFKDATEKGKPGKVVGDPLWQLGDGCLEIFCVRNCGDSSS